MLGHPGVLYTCMESMQQMGHKYYRECAVHLYMQCLACLLPPTPYEKLLTYLGSLRLELHHLHTDLILTYKIIHQFNFYHAKHFTSQKGVNSRGLHYKVTIEFLRKQVLSSLFTNRITPVWNILSDACFDVNNLLYCKHKLYSIDFNWIHKGQIPHFTGLCIYSYICMYV